MKTNDSTLCANKARAWGVVPQEEMEMLKADYNAQLLVKGGKYLALFNEHRDLLNQCQASDSKVQELLMALERAGIAHGSLLHVHDNLQQTHTGLRVAHASLEQETAYQQQHNHVLLQTISQQTADKQISDQRADDLAAQNMDLHRQVVAAQSTIVQMGTKEGLLTSELEREVVARQALQRKLEELMSAVAVVDEREAAGHALEQESSKLLARQCTLYEAELQAIREQLAASQQEVARLTANNTHTNHALVVSKDTSDQGSTTQSHDTSNSDDQDKASPPVLPVSLPASAGQDEHSQSMAFKSRPQLGSTRSSGLMGARPSASRSGNSSRTVVLGRSRHTGGVTNQQAQVAPAPVPAPANAPTQLWQYNFDAYVDCLDNLADLLATQDKCRIPFILPCNLELLEMIGRGGFGTVRRGLWNANGNKAEVAVKCVRLDQPHGCAKELEMLSRVMGKPHFLQLHGICLASIGEVYIVTEMLCCTISGYMSLPRSTQEIVGVSKEVVSAMMTLEEMGCCHRDIKTENVMFDWEGHIKLVDMGIALDTPQPGELFHMAGTEAFMSPQALRGEPPNIKGDVWAWGVTLWKALAKRLPFTKEQAAQVMRNQARTIRPTGQLPSSVHPALKALIKRCLICCEDKRPSPAEVMTALEDISNLLNNPLVGAPQPADASPDVTGASNKQQGPKRRRKENGSKPKGNRKPRCPR